MALAGNLSAISGTNGAGTTLDGTAYNSSANGTSIRDANPGTLEPSLVIGTGADGLTVAALL